MRTAKTTDQALHTCLARVSILGLLSQLLWVLIAGPVSLGRWDRPTTYLSFGMALLLVILWRTGPFQRYFASQTQDRTYPARAFIGNGFAILVVALFLLIELATNRYLFISWRSAIDLVFLGGALLIAVASLLANLIAYRLDRKDHASQ